MGYKYSMDGKCKVCEKFSDVFCDSCGQYICKTHQFTKEVGSGYRNFVQCKDCFRKFKKNIHPMKGKGVDYIPRDIEFH